MKSVSRENQADITEAFNSTSRYLDDLLNIDNVHFEEMVNQIYPAELQLNKANSSDTEAPFLDFNISSLISPNQYGPPVWRKSQIGDAEPGADI